MPSTKLGPTITKFSWVHRDDRLCGPTLSVLFKFGLHTNTLRVQHHPACDSQSLELAQHDRIVLHTMASTPSTSAPEFTPSSSTNTSADTISPLEQEVLDEYAKLLGNLNGVRAPFFQKFEGDAKQPTQLSSLVSELATNPSAEILDALRGLERKTSLVFTLLKASVYSIVLQQQIGEEEMGQSTNTRGNGK